MAGNTGSSEKPVYTGGDQVAGSAAQQCPPVPQYFDPEDPPETPVTVRVSLFFDGTMNNRTNVYIGKRHKELNKIRRQHNMKEVEVTGSYANDDSNVAILEKYWRRNKSYNHSFSIYIEGIGTLDGQSDSTIGGALGALTRGVTQKVEKGIKVAAEQITKRLGSEKLIKHVHLDAFGFSRGASAARHFVHASLKQESTKLSDKLTKEKGFQVDEVKVIFIGVYDTVASFGLYHGNDTRDLDLDSIRYAKKVVHLAAAEEHRENFRLTNIESVSSNKKQGIEIFLPGVHSDIGGGYNEIEDEKELQVFDLDVLWLGSSDRKKIEAERAWLTNQGWYKSNEFHKLTAWNELAVTRTGISNHYSRIPLHLMAKYAKEEGVKFTNKIKRDYHIDPKKHPLLPKVKKEIDKYIAKLSSGASSSHHWILRNDAMMRKLRYEYLHFSAKYNREGGLEVNAPRFVNGKRERLIQRG